MPYLAPMAVNRSYLEEVGRYVARTESTPACIFMKDVMGAREHFDNYIA
jgi:hypothetical protein